MRIVTADVMRELDRITIEEVGIPGAVLMENAGRGAAEVLLNQVGSLPAGPVAIVCGAGNNGGDGFVIARILHEEGFDVNVYLLVPPSRVRGDARIFFEAMNKLEIPWVSLAESGINRKVLRKWEAASCIVDAVFGTGLTRKVAGAYGKALRGISSSRKPVLSVDIPSGIHADTGQILGTAVHATWTATFGLPKRGLFLYPGADHAGEIECVDIGIPRIHVDAMGIQEELLEADSFLPFLYREPDTHKGTYGHLFVLGGSVGKTGAAHLCSEAALRCGTGLVTLGIPESLNPILEQKLTEVMTLPLPSSPEGFLKAEALDEILSFVSSVDGLAIGPGLGINRDTESVVREVWQAVEKPMIWDADALTLLARNSDLKRKQKAPVILTPHPGEMARLTGKRTSWIQANRVEAARALSEEWGVITVLKGARTLVTHPEGRLGINSTGNAGMASGGMGDVLTGLIGGLMLQGLDPFDAASFGVWLHGAAGDQASGRIGPMGFLASEVMEAVPVIFKDLVEGR